MYISESENMLHYGKVLSISNKVMNDGRYRTIRKFEIIKCSVATINIP